MDYKLNLITPSLYSKEGFNNCVDELVEKFAHHLKYKSEIDFNLKCKYDPVPGLAFIHSFEDFEERFLIHSEYAIIIASPASQLALNQFIPRLLVFLTSKPIWQNRFIFIILGKVKVLSNLVVNEPIEFSSDNWFEKDEKSWIELFDLIKIKWEPHVDKISDELVSDTSLDNQLQISNSEIKEIKPSIIGRELINNSQISELENNNKNNLISSQEVEVNNGNNFDSHTNENISDSISKTSHQSTAIFDHSKPITTETKIKNLAHRSIQGSNVTLEYMTFSRADNENINKGNIFKETEINTEESMFINFDKSADKEWKQVEIPEENPNESSQKSNSESDTDSEQIFDCDYQNGSFKEQEMIEEIENEEENDFATDTNKIHQHNSCDNKTNEYLVSDNLTAVPDNMSQITISDIVETKESNIDNSLGEVKPDFFTDGHEVSLENIRTDSNKITIQSILSTVNRDSQNSSENHSTRDNLTFISDNMSKVTINDIVETESNIDNSLVEVKSDFSTVGHEVSLKNIGTGSNKITIQSMLPTVDINSQNLSEDHSTKNNLSVIPDDMSRMTIINISETNESNIDNSLVEVKSDFSTVGHEVSLENIGSDFDKVTIQSMLPTVDIDSQNSSEDHSTKNNLSVIPNDMSRVTIINIAESNIDNSLVEVKPDYSTDGHEVSLENIRTDSNKRTNQTMLSTIDIDFENSNKDHSKKNKFTTVPDDMSRMTIINVTETNENPSPSNIDLNLESIDKTVNNVHKSEINIDDNNIILIWKDQINIESQTLELRQPTNANNASKQILTSHGESMNFNILSDRQEMNKLDCFKNKEISLKDSSSVTVDNSDIGKSVDSYENENEQKINEDESHCEQIINSEEAQVGDFISIENEVEFENGEDIGDKLTKYKISSNNKDTLCDSYSIENKYFDNCKNLDKNISCFDNVIEAKNDKGLLKSLNKIIVEEDSITNKVAFENISLESELSLDHNNPEFKDIDIGSRIQFSSDDININISGIKYRNNSFEDIEEENVDNNTGEMQECKRIDTNWDNEMEFIKMEKSRNINQNNGYHNTISPIAVPIITNQNKSINYNTDRDLEIINQSHSYTNRIPFCLLRKFTIIPTFVKRFVFCKSQVSSDSHEKESSKNFENSLTRCLHSPWCVLLVFVAGTLASPYWVELTRSISQKAVEPNFLVDTISSTVLHEETIMKKYGQYF